MGFQENTHREEINHGGLKTLILLFFCDRFKMLGWTGTSMWLFLFFMGYTVLLMSSCFALIAEGCRFSGLFNINKVCKPYTFLWVSLVKYWALYRGLQLHCKIYWTQVLVLMCWQYTFQLVGFFIPLGSYTLILMFVNFRLFF